MRLPGGFGTDGAAAPAVSVADGGLIERDHYEVLGDSGHGWSLLTLLENRDAAIAEANSRFGESRFIAVRVIKSSYDSESNEFREREALFLGERRRPLSGGPVDEDIGPVCSRVEHMFTAQARRTVRRLLGDWLHRQNIAAIELLYHVDHQQRLENAGLLLQSAVQRAARAQAGAAGGDVHKRLRDLYLLCDALSAQVRRIWREGRVLPLAGDDIAGLATAVAGEPDRSLLFNAALVAELRGVPTVPEKLRWLLGRLAANRRADVVYLLDGIIAGFLEEQAAVAEMMGPQPSLGAALLHLFDMLVGNPLPDAEPEIERLRGAIRRDELPRCRDVLARRLVASLRGSRPLVEHNVDAEMALHATFEQRFDKAPVDTVRLAEMREALEQRCGRFVTPSGLNRLLERYPRADVRFRCLLGLARGIVGDENRARMGDAIVAEMNDERFAVHLLKPTNAPVERMRELRALQGQVETSGLPGAHAALIDARLDDMCAGLARASRLYERLEQRDGDRLDKALALLALIAAGTFTRGTALAAAHRRVHDYLKRHGTTPQKRMPDLRRALRAAGMDEPASS